MTEYPEFLFVYGTLLAASRHPMGDLLRDHAQIYGEGSINARLYLIEEEDEDGRNIFPGAVPSDHPDDNVYGVVYQINREHEKLFAAFDDFEACSPNWPQPYEFLLRSINVTMATGALISASSYLYTWDTSRATLIPSGRYERLSVSVR